MEFHYLGPDGEGISALPEGVGAALGSDYCVHLLPDAAALSAAIEEAGRKMVPLLLLTPYFRDEELKRSLDMFRSIPPDASVIVSVNDWGMLHLLRTLFPRLSLTLGRLLSGQKRCPRIAISKELTEVGRRWHGEGFHSSPGAARRLRDEFGIRGIHADYTEWTSFPSEKGDSGIEPMPLYVHTPYAVVTVSDSCPFLGGASSASVSRCPRHCRNGMVVLREPSMGAELLQRGKARFVRTAEPPVARPEGNVVRFVRYGDVP